MARLGCRVARSPGGTCEISGGERRETGGDPSPPLPASRIPLPEEPLTRKASTVSSAPSAAPATPHGSPARHPDAWATPAGAPHLWQNRAAGESAAPHA